MNQEYVKYKNHLIVSDGEGNLKTYPDHPQLFEQMIQENKIEALEEELNSSEEQSAILQDMVAREENTQFCNRVFGITGWVGGATALIISATLKFPVWIGMTGCFVGSTCGIYHFLKNMKTRTLISNMNKGITQLAEETLYLEDKIEREKEVLKKQKEQTIVQQVQPSYSKMIYSTDPIKVKKMLNAIKKLHQKQIIKEVKIQTIMDEMSQGDFSLKREK